MDNKAYLNIFGALLINLTLGTFYSVSNLINYIVSYMRPKNPDVRIEHGAWITSSFLFGQAVFLIFGAFIENKFNSRVACIVGCVIHCSSTYLTSFALDINFTTLVLVYGLGSGFGCGSAYMACIISAQKWFPRSKGLVTGAIVSGFGLGGLIFTFLQTLYVNPENAKPDELGMFDETVNSKVPSLFMFMALVFTITQAIGCSLAHPPPVSINRKQNSSTEFTTTVTESALPNMHSLASAFKSRIFYVIGLMMMLVAPGVTFVNTFSKRYGQTFIDDDRFLATVVSLAAIANASGRISWGFLIDKFSFSTCFTIKVVWFSTLIMLFPFEFILASQTLYLLVILGLFFGFSGTFVLFPVFIEQVFGSKYQGSIYGILYIFLAIASSGTSFALQIMMSFTNATTENTLSSRIMPCVVIATMYILSLLLYAFLIPWRRLETAITRKRELEVMNSKNTLANRQDLFPVEKSSLAEKTTNYASMDGKRDTSDALGKENSLGSIVKFKDTSNDKKIKEVGRKDWVRV